MKIPKLGEVRSIEPWHRNVVVLLLENAYTIPVLESVT